MLSIRATVFAYAIIYSAQADNLTSINTDLVKKNVDDRTIFKNIQDLILLNRTSKFLSEDDKSKLALSLFNRNKSDPSVQFLLENYGDVNRTNVQKLDKVIYESTDYAGTAVLASDLLSLTSAVANVKQKECREQGYKFLDGLIMNKKWALQMFDASAKFPQGLLFGSSYHLGNFDECVAIEQPVDGGYAIKGQYCLATLQFPEDESRKGRAGRSSALRWAVCVPNSCSTESVESFVGTVVMKTVGNSSNVTVDSKNCYSRGPIAVSTLDVAFFTESVDTVVMKFVVYRGNLTVDNKNCYSSGPIAVSTLDVAFLYFILVFVGGILLSTAYEAYALKCSIKKTSMIHKLIICFSLINNTKKIISTKQNTSFGLEFVAGVKALAMCFILAGHACLFVASGPMMNVAAWDNLVRDPLNALMLSNVLLVDTFLMLSAFLFCRLLLLELDKRRGRINVIPILVFRYIRVTPAYIVVLLFYMTWLPKAGEGPLWQDRLVLEQERCIASWWTNVLYINNYVNSDKMCMFQSWYLSVDTQLFFIAPIFIYSLWNWRRVGITLLAVGIVASMAVPSIITYVDVLDPTLLTFAKEITDLTSNFYFKTAYIKTHMRMTPYFMGLITAYILHRIQDANYKFSRVLKSFAWTLSIVLGSTAVFSVSVFYQDWYRYDRIEAAAFSSLHKLAWCIANSWLIIACATNNGGILAILLKWKFLVPVSRLTFCAYLVNGIVELYYVGLLRNPVHVNFFTMFATAISHLLLTFGLGFALCVLFESPIHGIEKILLRKLSRPSDNARRQISSPQNASQTK